MLRYGNHIPEEPHELSNQLPGVHIQLLLVLEMPWVGFLALTLVGLVVSAHTYSFPVLRILSRLSCGASTPSFPPWYPRAQYLHPSLQSNSRHKHTRREQCQTQPSQRNAKDQHRRTDHDRAMPLTTIWRYALEKLRMVFTHSTQACMLRATEQRQLHCK